MAEAYTQGEVNPHTGPATPIESDTEMFFGDDDGVLGKKGGILSIGATGGSKFGVSLSEFKKNNKKKKLQKQKDAWNSAQAIQARIARAQWQDFKTRYVPIENKFMQLVRRNDNDKEAARGVATSDVNQAFDPAAQQMSVQKILSGDKAGSAGHDLAMIDAQIAKGSALGGAVNDADRTQESLDIQGRQKVVALGRNLADDSNLGLRTGAILSARNSAGRAEYEANRIAGNLGTAGAVVGAVGQTGHERSMNNGLRSRALDNAASNPNSSYITKSAADSGPEWERFNYGRSR